MWTDKVLEKCKCISHKLEHMNHAICIWVLFSLTWQLSVLRGFSKSQQCMNRQQQKDTNLTTSVKLKQKRYMYFVLDLILVNESKWLEVESTCTNYCVTASYRYSLPLQTLSCQISHTIPRKSRKQVCDIFYIKFTIHSCQVTHIYTKLSIWNSGLEIFFCEYVFSHLQRLT